MIFSSNAVVTTALMTLFGISSASSLHQTQDAHNNLRKNEKPTPMGTRNDWPVIGMFTQPSTSKHEDCNGDCLYLAASYVKYIESAGARVVPINYYATPEQLDYLFNSLNGFFFVGGGSSIPQSAQYIYDRTVEANDADDFMPLWGTCLGFEWLIIATSGDLDILDPKDGQMDAYNISLPLEFTSSARQSKLFRDAPPGVYEILAKKDVTMNNHHYGIFTDNFKATESLSSFYDIISVNKDRNGVEFVSTLEAFKYPIYATQWHPEKNPFEWEKRNGAPYEAINHSPEAIYIAQYTANFFVQQTRSNFHHFPSDEEENDHLIFNYHTSRTGPSFVESYYFKNDFF